MLKVLNFDCSRTCPLFERVDVCRFNRLLALAGVETFVNSHTVSVDVKFSNAEALAAAVGELGGTVNGFGNHQLYGGTVNGFGFTLPGWRFPLVSSENGKLSYDDYGGKWGNPADVEKLTAEYSFQAAKQAADYLGWLTERVISDSDGSAALRVYHPGGGYLDVSGGGSVDAFGFHGVGCHSAALELGAAMGDVTAAVAKAEYFENDNLNHEIE